MIKKQRAWFWLPVVLLASCGQPLPGGRLLTMDTHTLKICGDAHDPAVLRIPTKMFGAQRCNDAETGTAMVGETKATARAVIRKSVVRVPFVKLICDAEAQARRSGPPQSVVKKATASAEVTQTFILPQNGNWIAESHVDWEAGASRDQASAKYSFKVRLTGLQGAVLFTHVNGANTSATSLPNTRHQSPGVGDAKQKALNLQRGVRYTMSCKITAEATAKEKPNKQDFTFPKGDGGVRLYFTVSQ